MEVRELMFRRGLLSASESKEHRRIYPSAIEWDVKEVGVYLNQMGLGKYKAQFTKHQIDGPMMLRLTPQMLASLFDVEPNEYEANERAAELFEAHIALLKRLKPTNSVHDEL